MKTFSSFLVALCVVWSAVQREHVASASFFGGVFGSSKNAATAETKTVTKHAVVEDPHPIRGLPDHLIAHYLQDHFVCDGGKTVLKPKQINDGYCDCSDGKDEPGTSACSQGTFFCRNKGYKVIALPSSRVDDGVCDCCDASDEQPGACPNTCQAVASRERASLDRAITAYKAGHSQRKAWIQQAKEQLQNQAKQLPLLDAEIERVRAEQATAQQEADAHLASLSSSRQGILTTNKAQLDRLLLLEPDHLNFLAQLTVNLAEVLDVTEDQIDGLMTFRPATREHHDHHHVDVEDYGDEPVAATGVVSSCAVTDALLVPSTLLSGLCQVPEGQDTYAELYHVFHQLLKNYRPYSELFYLLGHYQLQGNQWAAEAVDYARNALVDTEPVDPNAAVDAAASSGASSCPADFAALSTDFCLLPEQVKTLLKPLLSEESAQQQDATYLQLKQRIHSLSNDIRDLERRRSEAQTAHNQMHVTSGGDAAQSDGDLAFQTLKDQCFDVVDGKFSYSLCVLSKVSQKEEHGNFNTVSLGSYSRLEAVTPSTTNQGAAYVMHFDNDQYCHAHGPRKADVTIRCGEKHQLLSAAEPSTCFYALQFESPVACTEEYAATQGILPYL